jgi:hypothetical protein
VIAGRVFALLCINMVSVTIAFALWVSVIAASDPSLSSFWQYVGFLVIPILVLLVLQVAILAPVLGKPALQPGTGRSIIVSGVLVGLVAAFLLSGLAMAIGEWFLAENAPNKFDQIAPRRSSIIFLIALPISWGIIGSLFCVTLLRSSSHNVLKRIVFGVLIASAAEFVLLIPINYIISKRTQCICSTGSALALGLSVTALAVLVGPFILLVLCNHRYRAEANAMARSNADD